MHDVDGAVLEIEAVDCLDQVLDNPSRAAARTAGLRHHFDDLLDDPTRASSVIRITGLRKFLYERTIVAAKPREQLAEIDRFQRCGVVFEE